MLQSSSTAPRKEPQSPGIFRGFVQSTPEGFLTPAQQGQLVKDILSRASAKSMREIRTL